ncbi:uncharacterized protein misp3 isoform 1-T1 [Synchiropus picturatus]
MLWLMSDKSSSVKVFVCPHTSFAMATELAASLGLPEEPDCKSFVLGQGEMYHFSMAPIAEPEDDLEELTIPESNEDQVSSLSCYDLLADHEEEFTDKQEELESDTELNWDPNDSLECPDRPNTEERPVTPAPFEQHDHKKNSSSPPCVHENEEEASPTVLNAEPATEQQGELSQSQPEPNPVGENQEAARQVLCQSPAPLSPVAIETANQGGTASQEGEVSVRERQGSVEERETVSTDVQGEEEQERNTTQEQDQGAHRQKQKTVGNHKTGVIFKPLMMESWYDDSQSDSSTSVDSSHSSSVELNSSLATLTKETPIEREIRRSIEREKSLRRSRGLPFPMESIEYVEIPSRVNILHQSPTSLEQFQGKERQFAGKKMQQEIHEETKRELDLVKLGKVPGYYDKGTVRQLKEKRQIFEAFQAPSDLASPTVSSRSKVTSWTTVRDDSSSSSSSSQTSSSDSSERRDSIEHLTLVTTPNSSKMPGPSPTSRRGPGYSESTSCQVIIVENNMTVPTSLAHHSSKLEAQALTTVDSSPSHVARTKKRVLHQEFEKRSEVEAILPKENPFFKLRPSLNVIKVEQDIRESQERERELHRQRVSLYGSTATSPTDMSSVSMNGQTYMDLPVSPSKERSRAPAVRQSVGRLGVWPPAPAAQAKMNRKEIHHRTTSHRHKSPLVDRWESGLVYRHSEDED